MLFCGHMIITLKKWKPRNSINIHSASGSLQDIQKPPGICTETLPVLLEIFPKVFLIYF